MNTFHSKSLSRSASSEYSQNFEDNHDLNSIPSSTIYCLWNLSHEILLIFINLLRIEGFK